MIEYYMIHPETLHKSAQKRYKKNYLNVIRTVSLQIWNLIDALLLPVIREKREMFNATPGIRPTGELQHVGFPTSLAMSAH